MEPNQDSSNKRLIGYLKILWKIVRDGFPLAIFSFLVTLPMISLPIFGGHESLAVLDVIALFVATDYTFMNNVNFSCGFAFQVKTYLMLCKIRLFLAVLTFHRINYKYYSLK